MKRLLSALLAAILLAGMVSAGEVRADGAEAALTLMVYMTGSDLESKGSAATGDILEMLRSGVDTSRVNVVLMVGGSTKWSTGFPTDKLSIYRLAENRPEQMEETELASMGEPETLRHLLDWGYKHCPAERYALILWDHGGGPMEGVCYDELYGGDTLSLPELREALEGSALAEAGEKLEWIGFDACLMGAVETAHVVAPHARYMIASQETEPGSGWDYGFLQGIEEDADGAATGKRIIDGYFAAAEGSESALTLSCVDLGKVGEVEAAMDGLFGELDREIDAESYSKLSNGRRDAKGFGRGTTGSDYDLVDLRDLGAQYEEIAPKGAEALGEAIAGTVVYARSNVSGSAGLSVYHPYYNKNYYTTEWGAAHPDLGVSEGYERYLKDYAGLWLGESLADWRGLEAKAETSAADGQELTMALTPEQAEHFASAELYIIEQDERGGAYYDIYHADAGAPEGGTLRARYEYEALYAMDEAGNPLSDALTYTVMDDTYLVRAGLSHYSYHDYENWMSDDPVAIYLRCRREEGSDELRVIDAIELPDRAVFARTEGEDALTTGKQTITLDAADWPWITFVQYPRMLPAARDGMTPAFPDWPYSNEVIESGYYLRFAVVDNAEPWTLRFCKRQYGGRNLYAQYAATDTQGERFASDLIPIENPNLVSRVEVGRTLIDNDAVCATFQSIEVADAESGGGMYLRMRLERGAKDVLSAAIENIRFDGTALDCTVQGGNMLLDWQDEAELVFFIPAEEFPPMAQPRIGVLTFDLVIARDYEEELGRAAVSVDEGIELGALAAAPVDVVLAEAVDGDVTYQLVGLSRREDGSLAAALHIVNGGAEDCELDSWGFRGAAVNGCFVYWGSRGEEYSLRVPAGCDLYTWVNFQRDGEESGLAECAFPACDAFEYWGVSEVRSLSILRADAEEGEMIRFDLAEPFPLEARDAPEGWALLDAPGVQVTLRGAELDDSLALSLHPFQDEEPLPGTLRLCVDVRCDEAAELGVEAVAMDGASGEAGIALETQGYVSGAELAPAGLTQRAYILIPLDGADAPERLELQFRWREPEGQWQHSGAAAVEFGTDMRVDSAEAAEQLVSEPVAAAAMFDPEVALTADAGACAAVLAAQLPSERAGSFRDAMVIVARREALPPEQGSDEPYSYIPVAILEQPELGADGVLRADFCGLLAYPAGGELPFMLYENPRRFYIYGAELSAADSESEDAYFSTVDLSLDAQGNQARVLGAQCERTIYSLERFDGMRVQMQAYVPAHNGDGSLTDIERWGVAYVALGGYAEVSGAARIELRPAMDEELFVIFSVRNVDGTDYALGPVPYAEAVEN